jgi:hypothetical protein
VLRTPRNDDRWERRMDATKQPDGQITCPSPAQKISRFPPVANHLLITRVPSLKRGARDRHETRDGMRWTPMRF